MGLRKWQGHGLEIKIGTNSEKEMANVTVKVEAKLASPKGTDARHPALPLWPSHCMFRVYNSL